MGSSRRLAVLGSVLTALAGCAEGATDVPPATVEAGTTPTATLRRHLRYDNAGNLFERGEIDLAFALGDEVQAFSIVGLRIEVPLHDPAWSVDDFEASAPRAAESTASVPAGKVEFAAHVKLSTVTPSPPNHAVTITVRVNGIESSVVPVLAETDATLDPCDAPSLDGVDRALGTAVDATAMTLPGLVGEPLDLRVDPTGRAFLLATYPNSAGERARVFSFTDDKIGPIAELGGLVGLAPGEGDGPTFAVQGKAANVGPSVLVSRRDDDLRERWAHEIAADERHAMPPVAVSGGRVLVFARVALPLRVDGVEIFPSTKDRRQLLLFDAATGDLVATRGGIDVTSATELANGAFVVVDDEGDGTTRVLESDLTDRWSIPGAGAVGTTPDGHVFVARQRDVLEYAGDGTFVRTIAGAAGRSIAPLADGSILAELDEGCTRVWADGAVAFAALEPAAVPWCSNKPPFLVARGPSGPVIAARLESEDAGAAGRGFLAELTLTK